MPYKKQKAIRSNIKDGIYDLMTDLGLLLLGKTILCNRHLLLLSAHPQNLVIRLRWGRQIHLSHHTSM